MFHLILEMPSRRGARLIIDRQAAHGIEGVAHRFPDGRMRVDGGGHVVERGFQAQRRDRLGDDFRRERADRVDAENFAVLRFGDDFDEAVVLSRESSPCCCRGTETCRSSLRSPRRAPVFR